MRGLIRTIVTLILVVAVGLALWKLTGGDIGGFFDVIGNVLYTIVDSVSNFFVNLFRMFTGE